MPQYCDSCFLPFEGVRCPSCGRKSRRPAEPDDLCFLAEKDVIWSGLLADVLEQNDIPFVRQSVLGAGLAIKTGLMGERFRFYVFFSCFEEAKEIVAELFSAAEICEEEGGGVEDADGEGGE